MLRSWWTSAVAVVVLGLATGLIAGLGDWSAPAIHAATWVACILWLALVLRLKPWENPHRR